MLSEPAGATGMFTQSAAPRLRSTRGGMLTRILSPQPDHYSLTNSLPGYGPRRSRWAAVKTLPARVYRMSQKRLGQRRGPAFLVLCCMAFVWSTLMLQKRYRSSRENETWTIHRDERTRKVVFLWDDLRKVWEWEILSGHYPSTRPIPAGIGFSSPQANPALPASLRPKSDDRAIVDYTVGTGPERIYPDVGNKPPHFGYPPRPIPGSAADLDRIYQYCDFDSNKYVRDCLEMLRVGAGLDDSARLRRTLPEALRYVYVLDEGNSDHTGQLSTQSGSKSLIQIRDKSNWKREFSSPPPSSHKASPCKEDDPRIFHMFWAGPFTDKPYMAMMAFLFTQNLGLHLDTPPSEFPFCRPQMWIWVSRGSLDDAPTHAAEEEMYDELRKNPWVSPFLHPRFKDIIQFHLWSMAEQLDNLPEMKDEWRGLTLSTDGHAIPQDEHEKKVGSNVDLDGMGDENHMTYNKVPVVLSDLARFVLCQRYGGVYLDVDMLLLRDWEELWGHTGSFSYRWSAGDQYNTAMLRLRRNSALGTFLLRTALQNGMDFHPVTISWYLKDAKLEQLLYRIPDALFDPAWLNTEWSHFQSDRPPMPFFTDFDQFFNTPQEMSGQPSAVGFDGFFRGAYTYHYHNEWWKPFDRARFWPDLGPRFAEAEQTARTALASQNTSYPVGLFEGDQQDLDWATVLKRTFEAYIRGERPNMYGEWLKW